MTSAIVSLLLFACLLTCGCTHAIEQDTEVKTQRPQKSLILYYSRSGNTRAVARHIQELTGADMLEIEPVTPYPEDDKETNKEELEDRKHEMGRPVKTRIEKIDSYEAIYIGYPIWSNQYPAMFPPLLKEYDMAGKTIIPFCTHAGSGEAGSFKMLADLLHASTHLEGFAVEGEKAAESRNEVEEWLKRIRPEGMNGKFSGWPMFHGPRGDNLFPETDLLESWPEDGPKLLWQISDIGEGASGYSTVSIQHNRLFTAGNNEGLSTVYCFDLNGNKLWEYANGKAWTGSYPGTRSTPTIDGSRVFDLSPVGELVCLNVENGEKIWGRNILSDFGGRNPTWALAESVRIDGNLLYCTPGGEKTCVVALDKMTGKTIWQSPSRGAITSYSSPIIFEQDGLRILATMYSKGLLGVDAETGNILFTVSYPQAYDIHATRPIYENGYIAMISTNKPRNTRGVTKFRVSVNGKSVSLKEEWKNLDFDVYNDAAILLEGYLYGATYDHKRGAFMCVDWKTGKTIYDQRDAGRGSFTYAEGLIYFLAESGDFRLLRANPAKYDVIARWSIPENGEGLAWAHPVIFDKKLYIRHGTYLYCYDISRE